MSLIILPYIVQRSVGSRSSRMTLASPPSARTTRCAYCTGCLASVFSSMGSTLTTISTEVPHLSFPLRCMPPGVPPLKVWGHRCISLTSRMDASHTMMQLVGRVVSRRLTLVTRRRNSRSILLAMFSPPDSRSHICAA